MIVFRLFAEKVPTLDDLNMSPVFKQLMQKTNGIIFVAGPTGSGKSTTLAAMIEEVNINKQKHIITLEDPIEYIFTPKKSLIEQKQL
jgi:twitching motility protein PilT